MKYLRRGRHTQEELEDIIDELLDEKHLNNEISTREKILIDYLKMLKSSCKSFKNDKLSTDDVIKNLNKSLVELFRDNNIY